MSTPTCNCCGEPLFDTTAHTFEGDFGKVCVPCGKDLRNAHDALTRAGMPTTYLGACGDNDTTETAPA